MSLIDIWHCLGQCRVFHLKGCYSNRKFQMQLRTKVKIGILLKGVVFPCVARCAQPNVLPLPVCQQQQLRPPGQPCVLHKPRPPHVLQIHRTVHRHGKATIGLCYNDNATWFCHGRKLSKAGRSSQCIVQSNMLCCKGNDTGVAMVIRMY